MARWRLLVAHYLNTEPSAEIEFKEVDQTTGRQARKVYKVPTLLDPKDQADHNYPQDGDIVVCDGNNPQPRDIIFLGQPTADMEPIDAEAIKITQQYIDAGTWNKPEPGLDFGESLIKTFMSKMEKLELNVQPVSAGAVDAKAFESLQKQVAALLEQNTKLQTQQARRA